MVVLSSRFTVLASLSVIAAFTLAPSPVYGVAIETRREHNVHGASHNSTHSAHTHSSNSTSSDSSTTHASTSKKSSSSSPSSDKPPVVPLPAGKLKSKVTVPLDSKRKGQDKRFIPYDPLNPLLQVGNLWIGDQPPPKRGMSTLDARRDHVVVNGDNDHVHSHGGHTKVVANGDNDHIHVHRRSPTPHRHGHHHHDEVIVNGDDDDVHFDRRSPSPMPHRHHHYDHHHDKVIVNGDNDKVHMDRRSPMPHRHHHHHHNRAEARNKRELTGLSTPMLDKTHAYLVPKLNRRHYHHHHYDGHSKVVVNGDHDKVHIDDKRELSAQGVPGTIDIMSNVAGSPKGQRIASLILSPSQAGTFNPSDPFILNASSTNQTQMYLVAQPSNDTSSSSNSTTPSNSAVGTASVESTGEPFVKVLLQIPMFDAESASMQSMCATFNSKPESPSPLSMEKCMQNGTQSDGNKSQVFAYEPDTGAVRPMWFEGEDDGMGDVEGDDDVDDSNDNLEDNDNETFDSPVDGGNSTSIAPQDPTTPPTSKTASVTNFGNEMQDTGNGDSTPPFGHLFATAGDSYATAHNVTLMFSPAAPMIAAVPSSPSFQQKTEITNSTTNSTDSTTASASASSTQSATSTSIRPSSTLASSSTPASSSTLATSSTLAISSHSSQSLSSSPTASVFVAASPSSVSSVSSSSSLSVSSTTSASGSKSTSAAVSTGTSSNIPTGSGSAMPTTTTASALDVEVFDPNVTASSSASMSTASATTSSGSTLSALSSSAASSTVSSSASSSMTPVSTAPYEWMFREGLVKSA
ncbi:hypothetical protein K474DRAFT_1696665 [Panus rudis PR-1116 ss-1]|nr:hypothetical protein K474DRAFT_1696665 [Panus rudis PR-1116 ss-1]